LVEPKKNSCLCLSLRALRSEVLFGSKTPLNSGKELVNRIGPEQAPGSAIEMLPDQQQSPIIRQRDGVTDEQIPGTIRVETAAESLSAQG
jgi:hypothetical protein